MPIVKTTVKTYDVQDFIQELRDYRHIIQFSEETLELIFEYLQECYSDRNWEMNVHAVCCEFAESSEENIRKEYDIEEWEEVDEFLNNETSIVGKTQSGRFVYVSF